MVVTGAPLKRRPPSLTNTSGDSLVGERRRRGERLAAEWAAGSRRRLARPVRWRPWRRDPISVAKKKTTEKVTPDAAAGVKPKAYRGPSRKPIAGQAGRGTAGKKGDGMVAVDGEGDDEAALVARLFHCLSPSICVLRMERVPQPTVARGHTPTVARGHTTCGERLGREIWRSFQ